MTLQGRRVEDPGDRFKAAAEGVLLPGDYFKDAQGNWNVCVPNSDASCAVRITGNSEGDCDVYSNWKVTEHEDRTITVSPSIRQFTSVDGKAVETYHGHLVKGQWVSC